MEFIVYQLIITITLLLSPIIILLRIIKNKEDKKRFLEKFCFFSKTRKNGKLIWFHGSSVGEIMSIIPIIKYYENKSVVDQILITSSTMSSANILNKYKFKKTIHQFFPIDFYFMTRKFLNYWKPTIAIFLESEIWPSIFNGLRRKKIPLVLLNARITNKSFNKWYLIKRFAQNIFNNINYSYPQNFETSRYLKKLNVKNVKLIGNLKFIENPYDKVNFFNKNLIKKFSHYKVWVAASTHKDEEIICAIAHKILKKKIKNLITIIIPRHINRVESIISKIKNLGLNIILHSKKEKLNNSDIYLVDTYGESRSFYKIAKTVFLGGSIIKHGGQNPLEAARYGAKILHGKNIKNFRDIYKYLKKLNFSKSVSNSKQIAQSINFGSLNKNNYEVREKGKEILKKTTEELNILIKHAIQKA